MVLKSRRQWLNWLNSRGSDSKNYKNGVHVVPVSLQIRRRTKGGVVDDSWQCSRGAESVRVSRGSFQSVSHQVGAS